MTMGATIIFEIGMYVANILKFGIEIEILPFVLTLVVEILYNILLVIILYPGMKKLGYYIENLFKNKKLLTRYF